MPSGVLVPVVGFVWWLLGGAWRGAPWWWFAGQRAPVAAPLAEGLGASCCVALRAPGVLWVPPVSGIYAFCHCTSPTQRGHGAAGWLRTRTRLRLELCTCTGCSHGFPLVLVLTHIIGISIKLRGGRPLLLLLCIQYFMQILILLLLVTILIVWVCRLLCPKPDVEPQHTTQCKHQCQRCLKCCSCLFSQCICDSVCLPKSYQVVLWFVFLFVLRILLCFAGSFSLVLPVDASTGTGSSPLVAKWAPSACPPSF